MEVAIAAAHASLRAAVPADGEGGRERAEDVTRVGIFEEPEAVSQRRVLRAVPSAPPHVLSLILNRGDVKWNFDAKFLINKAGNVEERFSDGPASREATIKALLAAA